MAKGARWEWWQGRWDERDACGAFVTMEAVETGEAESICRNGGSNWGPFSRFMKDRNPEIRAEYEAAMEAAMSAAESATNGYMAKKGAPAQYQSARAWYPVGGGRPPSERYASDELLDHWNAGGVKWMPLSVYRRGYQEQFAHPGEAA